MEGDFTSTYDPVIIWMIRDSSSNVSNAGETSFSTSTAVHSFGALILNDRLFQHRLSNYYRFVKPNDVRALVLMNRAAAHVVRSIPEIVLAYGVSDEFSFVFHRSTDLFERRAAKIVSTVVSSFTAAYVLGWNDEFQAKEEKEGGGSAAAPSSLSLDMLPTFDGRAVCYPSWENLRDYLSWRQVDCKKTISVTLPPLLSSIVWSSLSHRIDFANKTGHINNLYNTTFWALVQQGGMTHTQAEEHLKGTVAADKNEILFSRFGVNYNNEPEMYRKGSVVYREYALEPVPAAKREGDGVEPIQEGMRGNDDDRENEMDASSSLSKTQEEKMRKARRKAQVVVSHVDIIRDEFWIQRPWIRSGRPGRLVGG